MRDKTKSMSHGVNTDRRELTQTKAVIDADTRIERQATDLILDFLGGLYDYRCTIG